MDWLEPVAPCGPVGPVTPCGPVGPVAPCGPVGPVTPCGPVGPVAPCGPVGPVTPCGPVGPVTPCGPVGACWTGNAFLLKQSITLHKQSSSGFPFFNSSKHLLLFLRSFFPPFTLSYELLKNACELITIIF